jgi:hypothetical protein
MPVIYLVARSSKDRDLWVDQLQLVISQRTASEEAQQSLPISLASSESQDTTDIQLLPPSVKPSHVFQGLTQRVIQRLDSAASILLSSSDHSSPLWKTLFERDGLRCSRLISALPVAGAGEGMVSIRGDIFFPFSIPEIFSALLDRQLRCGIQPDIDAYPPIKWLSHHTGVEYIRYKSPLWPTLPRDYCTLLHWRLLTDGSFLFYAVSEPSVHYPVQSHLIRGDLHVGGYIMKHVAGGTHLSLIVQVDVGGQIPRSIANLVISKRPRMLLHLRASLEQLWKGKTRPDLQTHAPPSYEGRLIPPLLFSCFPSSLHSCPPHRADSDLNPNRAQLFFENPLS